MSRFTQALAPEGAKRLRRLGWKGEGPREFAQAVCSHVSDTAPHPPRLMRLGFPSTVTAEVCERLVELGGQLGTRSWWRQARDPDDVTGAAGAVGAGRNRLDRET